MIVCKFEDDGEASLRHLTVGCLVVREGKILLAKRNAKLLEGGKWCLLGGFADRDETIAEAVRREVMEESGWEIGELTLMWINDNTNRPGEDRQTVDLIYLFRSTGEKEWRKRLGDRRAQVVRIG